MSRTELESLHEPPGIVHPTERDWEETLAATRGIMIDCGLLGPLVRPLSGDRPGA
jgi:hypothetical protein